MENASLKISLTVTEHVWTKLRANIINVTANAFQLAGLVTENASLKIT